MRPAAFLIILALSPAPAAASGDDAWEQFRAAVEASCRALVQDPGVVTVEVNPFGSQRFGAAIVTLAAPGGGTDRMICIYDKVAMTAEMTAPF
jgi:hypothetical protein